MILVGLMGVTNCGDDHKEELNASRQTIITQTKFMNDPSNTPSQIMNNVLNMSLS